MSPTQELSRRIHDREAALRSRAAETAVWVAELQDMHESLRRLERNRSDIRGAIEDALSGNNNSNSNNSNQDPNTSVAPADLIELAVEGSNPFEGNANGNLATEEAVRLALASMRDDMGPKGLVKFIIQAAVETSGLKPEDVIKAALDTVGGSELTVEGIVVASLEAARSAGPLSAREILRHAAGVASRLDIQVPVMIKEMFTACAAALMPDRSMIRSSVLSVLGYAMGMGMTYEGLMDVMETFSEEVRYGARASRAADVPDQRSRPSTPPQTEDLDRIQHQPSFDSPGHVDTTSPVSVRSINNLPLHSLGDGIPGTPSRGDRARPFPESPELFWPYRTSVFNFDSDGRSVVFLPNFAKRGAVDEEDNESDGNHRFHAMSHFAKLREQFASKENQLKDQIKTVEELDKLTKQLEEQKLALSLKSAELNEHTDEVTGMKSRLDLLSDLAGPLDAAMETKSTSIDVVQQVLEAAIRKEHLTSSDVMQRTVSIAKGVGGRTRGDVLDEILVDLIDDEQGLKAAIEFAMANFASPNDVLKCALATALKQGAKPKDLLESVAKTAYEILGEKAKADTSQPAKETPTAARNSDRKPARKPARKPEHEPERNPEWDQERWQWL
ncbi:hypothetical protein DHEL01_v211151 [Diaporthe helianthi]|uniref:Uncharacterized protein n=1 Tax=Diaporthe helianthi TaxID=158607 RepID=A0A2P5HJM4_DIAHE|nr:hypothetical protein DHEL01_v211151 [Diaporthe helianthi]